MADVFSKRKRSEIMSLVKGRGNVATELAVVRLLRASRVTGWRRGYDLPGKPDIVFPRFRVAIFVDGCFWHKCPTHSSIPTTNRTFWRAKLERNAARDRAVNRILTASGWRILRLWQHELKNSDAVLKRIERKLRGSTKSKSEAQDRAA